MVTETSAWGNLTLRARWMNETITAVTALRRERIPVVGYTWFPLITMIDWAYRTGRRPLHHYLLHLGLYEANFDSAGVLPLQHTPL
ncbi:MAG TPA: hypothetical protein PKE45_08880, partial [Caldilineaceae bacterium]|nr:hypothetical protein [Caldilineaceae bacterium]